MSIPPLASAGRMLRRAGSLMEKAAALRVDDPERHRIMADAAELVSDAHPPRCAAGCRTACPEGVHDAHAH